MRVLCLLIFLCRASLYQSDFKHLTINCIAENDEHLENCNLTPPCIQNFSLTNCNTLQLQCTDSTNNHVCSSSEECRLANITNFVDTLLGAIYCTYKQKTITCYGSLLCTQFQYLCKENECEMKHLTENNKYRCKFDHSVTKCIKENENLPIKGELKCNVTPKVVDTTQSGSSVCEGFHTNTEGNNCDSQRPYLILFIFFAILSAGLLVYIVCIGKRKGCKTLNICENDQGRQHPAEPRNIWNEEVPLRE
ncbi:uncharacterized protein LOC127632168 isoform X1 [Xyrauchen texanus]|uniref:uncharacterized protein LOC127632168 isoform X1 n=1 Tax=Xyrauchen texanus TaxID=154827 RepID=UPI002241B41E|nr:uncharacterized protein LOC127632168 isoform X1 [Xyrauchen texanus]XP_051966715.1 uncharacterized protein LOC127632168 isoform X1 [Xyrauchen texanus]